MAEINPSIALAIVTIEIVNKMLLSVIRNGFSIIKSHNVRNFIPRHR